MKIVAKLVICLVALVGLALPAQVLATTTHSAKQNQTVSSRVNINSATADQLQVIPGIGEKLAERIVNHRTKNGNFHSPQELTRVRGIGEKSLAKFLPWVTIK
jgi:competence protein ComEA